ncbi:hypothetical protein BpHYR1_037980 [Brachionus plicatilis]|uniref:Uncharacterized protein n=1 Tax=Brachionus plicatilis TaxID=10195 RepID=A0A3M7QME6_BRAPC|nr:hypothetical protein BpHYR1_037980 [Brachionus plicatilis]
MTSLLFLNKMIELDLFPEFLLHRYRNCCPDEYANYRFWLILIELNISFETYYYLLVVPLKLFEKFRSTKPESNFHFVK